MVHTLNNDFFFLSQKNGCPAFYANLLSYIRLSEREVKSKFEKEGGKKLELLGWFYKFLFLFFAC